MSIEAQRAKVRACAEVHDLQLVEVLTDEGRSTATLERPGLQRALAMLRDGEADGFVVTRLDRITRRPRGLLDLIEDLCQERHPALVSIAEKVDTTTAGGCLVLTVLGALVDWERETVRERTRDALAHLRSEEVQMGRDGLGWRYAEEVNAEGRRVVERVPEEERVVRRIKALHGRGYSLRTIAARLEEDGVRTKTGGTRGDAKVIRDVLGPCRKA